MDVDRDFTAYVAQRRVRMFRTACLICGDPDQAEDIVQDALPGHTERMAGAGAGMRRSTLHTRNWGRLDVVLEQQASGTWKARLAQRHPRLPAIGGAVGDSPDTALSALAGAVHAFGSGWPAPARNEQHEHPYVSAGDDPPRVVVTVNGEQMLASAVGWRGEGEAAEVWVCWAEAAGLDSTAWVPAGQVRRRDTPTSSVDDSAG